MLVTLALAVSLAGPSPIWNPNADLPECSAVGYPEFFEKLPVPIDVVAGVIPAGTVSDHIVPASVMYFGVPMAEGQQATPYIEVRAGGSFLITALEHGLKNGIDDWHIIVAPCKQVRFRLHHVTNLVGDLAVRADEILRGERRNGLDAYCVPNTPACFGLVNQWVDGGTLLGSSWWPGMNTFNISVKDNYAGQSAMLPGLPAVVNGTVNYDRYHMTLAEFAKALDIPLSAMSETLFEEVSPSRTAPDHLHVRCQADYFKPAESARIRAKFPPWPNPVTTCGQFIFDQAATLAGNWFRPGTPVIIPGNEDTALAFFNSPVSGAPVISIGERNMRSVPVMDGQNVHAFTFEALNTGVVRVRFDQAVYNPQQQTVYCYDHLQAWHAPTPYTPGAPEHGALFATFVNDHRIIIEWAQGKDCSYQPQWAGNAVVLER